jgi:anti-sigma B factor antagonist
MLAVGSVNSPQCRRVVGAPGGFWFGPSSTPLICPVCGRLPQCRVEWCTIVASESEDQSSALHAVHGGPGVEHEQASFFLDGLDGCMVVFAVGEIDIATSDRFREVMLQAVESSRRVIVDLSGVTFLDSTGLGVLLGAQKRVATTHHSLCLVGPTRLVAKVLSITRVDETIPVHPNLDAAYRATNDG